MTPPPFYISLQLHHRLFCLGLPSFVPQRKNKEKKGKNLCVWCREVLGDVLTRVRSSQENAGSTIPLRGTTPGTEMAHVGRREEIERVTERLFPPKPCLPAGV